MAKYCCKAIANFSIIKMLDNSPELSIEWEYKNWMVNNEYQVNSTSLATLLERTNGFFKGKSFLQSGYTAHSSVLSS